MNPTLRPITTFISLLNEAPWGPYFSNAPVPAGLFSNRLILVGWKHPGLILISIPFAVALTFPLPIFLFL